MLSKNGLAVLGGVAVAVAARLANNDVGDEGLEGSTQFVDMSFQPARVLIDDNLPTEKAESLVAEIRERFGLTKAHTPSGLHIPSGLVKKHLGASNVLPGAQFRLRFDSGSYNLQSERRVLDSTLKFRFGKSAKSIRTFHADGEDPVFTRGGEWALYEQLANRGDLDLAKTLGARVPVPASVVYPFLVNEKDARTKNFAVDYEAGLHQIWVGELREDGNYGDTEVLWQLPESQ